MKTADLKIAEPYVVTRGFPNGLVYPIRNTVWSKRTRPFGAESQFEPGKRNFADNGVLVIVTDNRGVSEHAIHPVEEGKTGKKARRVAKELASLSDAELPEALKKHLTPSGGFYVNVVTPANITDTLEGFNKRAVERAEQDRIERAERESQESLRNRNIEGIVRLAESHGISLKAQHSYSYGGGITITEQNMQDLSDLLEKLS